MIIHFKFQHLEHTHCIQYRASEFKQPKGKKESWAILPQKTFLIKAKQAIDFFSLQVFSRLQKDVPVPNRNEKSNPGNLYEPKKRKKKKEIAITIS